MSALPSHDRSTHIYEAIKDDGKKDRAARLFDAVFADDNDASTSQKIQQAFRLVSTISN